MHAASICTSLLLVPYKAPVIDETSAEANRQSQLALFRVCEMVLLSLGVGHQMCACGLPGSPCSKGPRWPQTLSQLRYEDALEFAQQCTAHPHPSLTSNHSLVSCLRTSYSESARHASWFSGQACYDCINKRCNTHIISWTGNGCCLASTFPFNALSTAGQLSQTGAPAQTPSIPHETTHETRRVCLGEHKYNSYTSLRLRPLF